MYVICMCIYIYIIARALLIVYVNLIKEACFGKDPLFLALVPTHSPITLTTIPNRPLTNKRVLLGLRRSLNLRRVPPTVAGYYCPNLSTVKKYTKEEEKKKNIRSIKYVLT